MELTIYTKRYKRIDPVQNFIELYYSLQMKYLASDLLRKGLSPEQISDAVIAAVKIAKSSGMDTRKHFLPVYSAVKHEIIKDCKLSQLGYGLVLMNAKSNLSFVGDFQVSILESSFKANI